MTKREKHIRGELANLAADDRAQIVKDYLMAGGEDAEIVAKIESHRKPARRESPKDKSVRPVQTK